jgi:hypothetical protein
MVNLTPKQELRPCNIWQGWADLLRSKRSVFIHSIRQTKTARTLLVVAEQSGRKGAKAGSLRGERKLVAKPRLTGIDTQLSQGWGEETRVLALGNSSPTTSTRLPALFGRPGIATILCVGTLAYWTGLLVDCIPLANKWDFSLYYIQSLAMRHGVNPYITDVSPLGERLGLQAAPIRYAVDTPTFLLLFEPLTRLSPAGAHLIWTVLGSIAFALALFVSLDERNINRASVCSIAAIMCFFPPVIDHFQQGQSQVFVLLMLALSMRLLEKHHDRSAGLMLAAATLLRLYPAVLAGYLVVRGKWLSLGCMIAGVVVGGVFTASMLVIGRTLSFLTALGLASGHNLLSLPTSILIGPNLGMGAFLTKAIPNGSASVLTILKITFSLLFVGLTASITWSKSAAADIDNRAFAIWTATMLMIAPVVWLHYLVILLLIYAQMILAYSRGNLTNTTVWLAIASVLWIVIWSDIAFKFGTQMSAIELRAIAVLSFPGLMLAWMAAFSFASERPCCS